MGVISKQISAEEQARIDAENEKYEKQRAYNQFLGDKETTNKGTVSDMSPSEYKAYQKALFAQRNPSNDPDIAAQQKTHKSQYWLGNKAAFDVPEGTPEWANQQMNWQRSRVVDDSDLQNQRSNLMNQRYKNMLASRGYQSDALDLLQSQSEKDNPQARLQAAIQRDALNKQYMQAMSSGDPAAQRQAMMQSNAGMQGISGQAAQRAFLEKQAAQQAYMQGQNQAGVQDVAGLNLEGDILGKEQADLASRRKYFLDNEKLAQQTAGMGIEDKLNRYKYLQALEADRAREMEHARALDYKFSKGDLDQNQYNQLMESYTNKPTG